MERVILHIDMNAYYATVEQINNPALINKPVVVGHDGRKGVVTTASYEARKYGIHSAMPIFIAKKLCKNLVIVPPNFNLYEKYHTKFLSIIRRYFKIVEVASIDECYVDASEYLKDKDPLDFAKFLQHKIYQDSKLKSSIGISYNKFLAKMASDMKKPMGVTIIYPKDVKDLIWPLKISKMYGIGKKTAPRLIEIGINTIGDLATYPDDFILKSILGKSYLYLKQRANGIDFDKVLYDQGPLKSVGNSTPLDEDTSDVVVLKSVLRDLSTLVYNRLIDASLVGDSLSITIRYDDFSTVTRSMKLSSYTNDFETIYSGAIYLFNENYEFNRKVRLLGVTLMDTKPKEDVVVQMSLFDDIVINVNETDLLIEDLNRQIGKNVFKKASETLKNKDD